jgi:hypothetical protein
MKIIFILLSIVIILFIIHYSVKEHFLNDDTAFLAKYKQFMNFYNTFLPTWKQGITTSYGTSLPAGQPMGNPTMQQLNQYIEQLTQKEGIAFPPVTDPLPDAKTVEDIMRVKDTIPRTSAPISNALRWMNANLVKAHDSMKDALKGIQGFTNFKSEPFEDICQQIQTCQQAQKAQQQAQQAQQMADAKQWMEPVFDSVTTLQPLLDENTRLVAKSKAIQAKAQSGDLLPKVEPRKSPYKLPPGSDKKLTPEQEKEYQQNFAQLYGIKQWTNQINGALR